MITNLSLFVFLTCLFIGSLNDILKKEVSENLIFYGSTLGIMLNFQRPWIVLSHGLMLFAVVFALSYFIDILIKRQSFGGGDVKFCILLGIFLGFQNGFFVFTISLITCYIWMSIFRKNGTPMIPHISVFSILFLIIGRHMLP